MWTRFRQSSLNVVFVILMLSASGPARQAPSHNEKPDAAVAHPKTIEYKNIDYGFSLTLPESWKGYRVLWSEWVGVVQRDDGGVARELRGPQLRIRHPQWTREHPREDMPIMIFTIDEWNQGPVVSPAPFGPTEIGRNKRYVFAVPPRWDYDFSEGWEEAEKILVPGSLHTFAPSK